MEEHEGENISSVAYPPGLEYLCWRQSSKPEPAAGRFPSRRYCPEGTKRDSQGRAITFDDSALRRAPTNCSSLGKSFREIGPNFQVRPGERDCRWRIFPVSSDATARTSFTLFLVQRSSSQGHIYGNNLQKMWRFIDDQTGRHELQRVLAMRYSLFIQACSLFH